jgi:two-component system, OmpR family, alkaline phosphatase synthesis response regulator PhoP
MADERILIVDDEEFILKMIEFQLSKGGYKVSKARTGEEAIDMALTLNPDLMLLDWMLPGVDGLEVLKVLKNNPATARIPIVMVTARGEESDVVAGLERGADDYVLKPFSLRILLARIQVVLRRKSAPDSSLKDIIELPGLRIDVPRHEVRLDGKGIILTYTEFALLHLFAQSPERVFTRNQIIDSIRGSDYPVTDRSVDVQIVNLRKKLGAHGNSIETIRGVGYRFRISSPDSE